jgi:hypothetical protein
MVWTLFRFPIQEIRMASSSAGRRKAGNSGKTVDQAAERTAANDDGTSVAEAALDRWSDLTAREFAAWSLGATASMLRGVQAVQQAQLEAARDAQQIHEQAAAQLDTVHSFADFARLQMTLAQSDSQVALQSMSKIGELASRQAIDALNDSAAGWAHFSNTAWTAALDWMNGLARTPSAVEAAEAEMSPIVNAVAAGPIAWPAQEAARQAMTMATSAWNDWLTWSNRWADATRETMENAAPTR